MAADIALPLILLGFAATIGQILVLRELLTVLAGSELGLTLVLASWLLWTGCGSFAAGRLLRSFSNRLQLFAWLQAASGLVLVAAIFAIRAAPRLLGVELGEIPSLGQALALALLVPLPFCWLSGALFSLGCQVLADGSRDWRLSPGLVYLLEGLGAGTGGLLFTLLLVQKANHIQVAGIVALLVLAAAMMLLRRRPARLRTMALAVMAGLAIGAGLVLFRGHSLELLSRQWQWPGYRLLASRETPYGHLAVAARGEEVSFFASGLWNFTAPDPLSREQEAHYGLLQHPAPKRVLLIGGGVAGAVGEILRHPGIHQVDYVELDPALVELGRRCLPAAVTSALDDPRVRVHYEDGRTFVAATRESYDLILVNLPEPFTAQLNRFYTREFFALAAHRLGDDGILAFAASGAEAALGPLQAEYLHLLWQTAAAVFADVVVYPGAATRFFAAKRPGILTRDPRILAARLKERRLDLLFLRPERLIWDLDPLRLAAYEEIIKEGRNPDVNLDLDPKAYFLNLHLWGFHHSPRFWNLVRPLASRQFLAGVLAVALLSMLSLPWLRRWLQISRRPLELYAAVAVVGATGIGLSIVIIFCFQVFFGNLYARIGLLVTLYMLGLTAGSAAGSIWPRQSRRVLPAFALVQGTLALFCLGLAAFTAVFHAAEAGAPGFFRWELFSLLPCLAGFLGGAHFPLASRWLTRAREEVGATGGTLYGLDLAGSCLGSMAVGLLLLPMLGVLAVLGVLALLNAAAAVAVYSLTRG